MTMTERYFKILVDGKSCHGGDSVWSLPDGDKPGDWMPKLTKLVPCEHGYHIVMAHQIPWWMKNNCQIFEVETSGKVINDSDKFVCGKVRLVKHMQFDPEITPRLFAADCVEHVLHYYEDKYPGDDRPRKSIEAGRKYARKQITREEMESFWSAAWDAIQDVAGDDWVVQDVARAAAWAATPEAAGAAAWESFWAAAWDAVRAANMDTALAAAWVSTRDAAWEAEQDWQGQQLLKYLDGELS